MQSELLQKIEYDAAKGEPVPKELNPPETMLFYMLSGLYAQYHAKQISKDDAQQRKRYALMMYKRYKEDYEQFCDICKRYQEQIRNSYASNTSESNENAHN